MDENKQKALKSFANCAALYTVYRQCNPAPKRAALHGSNVQADGCDYLCDFVLKSKRAAQGAELAMVLRICEHEEPLRVPEYLRQRIGQVFLDYKLEDAYSALFSQALKNKTRAEAAEYSLAELSAEQIESAFESVEPAIEYLGDEAV